MTCNYINLYNFHFINDKYVLGVTNLVKVNNIGSYLKPVNLF